ncbi:hypothetical protein [Pedobacter agri]|uniref:hypothetical protein n=1 Tax=Pedobacter agri TaxID=454586 RepID=UPI00292EAE59|nr:hypothetical protein [Pedobacter agri]
MGLLKYVVLGAVTVYGLQYVTRKRSQDGKSKIADFNHHLNDLFGKVRDYKEKVKLDYQQTTQLY